MLAAPSAHQGVGVTFSHSACGSIGRGADLLVTVSAASNQWHPPDTGDENMCTTPRSQRVEYREPLLHALHRNIRVAHYPTSVTPGILSHTPLGEMQANSGSDNSSSRGLHTLEPRNCKDGRPQRCAWKGGSPTLEPVLLQDVEDAELREKKLQEERNAVADFGRRLAGLVGGRRRQGPGPGGGLWVSGRLRGRSNSNGSSHLPKKDKTLHTIKFLEAGLTLKGMPGAGGLPGGSSQKIDMPYSKQLAKWGYDEILGIPKTVVPGRGS